MRKDFERWDFKKKPTLKGTFVRMIPNVGRWGTNMYIFDVKGRLYNIWGSVNIDRDLVFVLPPKKLIVKYLGEVATDNGFKAKNYKIRTWGPKKRAPILKNTPKKKQSKNKPKKKTKKKNTKHK